MESILQSAQPSDNISLGFYLTALAAGLIFWGAFSYYRQDRLVPRFSVILPKNDKVSPAIGWVTEGIDMIMRGLKSTTSVFQILTGTGPVLIIPNRFADEMRNNRHLSFNRYFDKDFFVNYPGFEAYKTGYQDGTFIQEVVRGKLTQSLGLVTKDLVNEMTLITKGIVGEDPKFHEIALKELVSKAVARLSSRVFLGEELAHDERWLEIATTYTHDSFAAAGELRQWPALLRPFVHWYLPNCRRLRAAVRDATNLISPEVERRKERVRKALEAGVKPPKVSDAIGWMHEISRGRQVNYVYGQLFLSFAAIHTTTETIMGCLWDICGNPEVVEPLREEIIQVLSEHGWAKTSLYKLRLMDSFMKESQRLHPMGITSMHSHADQEVPLSDGTIIPKGSRVMVTAESFMDPSVYPEPEKFDMYRFHNLRSQPGQENNWQYVTTSPQHLLFSHGQHACPGRFFASNEMKIALCHFLLKYDWKKCASPPGFLTVEAGRLSNPEAKVMIRRRKEEINLDTVSVQ